MLGFFSLHGRPTVNTTYQGVTECALPGQHAAMFEMFRTLVPTGARVLDLASGRGAWARRLTDGGYRVTACDLHPELAAVPCQRVDLNGPFAQSFDGELFDAVTAIEMLEHLENPRHVLREAARLVQAGGLLLLSTPNASGLHSRVKFLFTGRFAQFDDEQYRSIGHISPLTYWEIDKILVETGFAIRKVTFHNHYNWCPSTLGEVVKLTASALLRPLVRGVAGGQAIVIAAEKVPSFSRDIHRRR